MRYLPTQVVGTVAGVLLIIYLIGVLAISTAFLFSEAWYSVFLALLASIALPVLSLRFIAREMSEGVGRCLFYLIVSAIPVLVILCIGIWFVQEVFGDYARNGYFVPLGAFLLIPGVLAGIVFGAVFRIAWPGLGRSR